MHATARKTTFLANEWYITIQMGKPVKRPVSRSLVIFLSPAAYKLK